jgi:hypothetical protein
METFELFRAMSGLPPSKESVTRKRLPWAKSTRQRSCPPHQSQDSEEDGCDGEEKRPLESDLLW